MTAYLKTLYVRISQKVCKYTKAISLLKKKKLCFSDRRANNETFGGLTIYEGWNFNSGTYLQLIQNRYMFRSFTVLQCSHQHCVQPVASDVKVLGYL